jgi:hypothetical protein
VLLGPPFTKKNQLSSPQLPAVSTRSIAVRKSGRSIVEDMCWGWVGSNKFLIVLMYKSENLGDTSIL